jgi:hypothetical protein
MKILYFFLFLWVIFALLDPELDPATQINADPDPQPCLYGSLNLLAVGKTKKEPKLRTEHKISTQLWKYFRSKRGKVKKKTGGSQMLNVTTLRVRYREGNVTREQKFQWKSNKES